jgi:uncharacterized repeat protein (TIGR01451 family)
VAVIDTTPPTITSPLPTVNVQCRANVPAPDTSLVTATDVCSTVLTKTWVSDVSDHNTCPEIITRTYRVYDGCLNHADAIQYIRVHDTIPPTIVCPQDVTRECGNVTDTGTPIVSDNCTTDLVPESTDSIVPGGGPGCYIIERTWRVSDACRNTASCVQRITVVDNVPPTIVCAPNDTIACSDPLVFPVPSASDLCAGSITPTIVSTDTVFVPGTDEVQYTRCWEASDGCDNTARCCQTITVEACPFVPLEVEKTSSVVDCVNPGSVFTYTMSYRNPNAGGVTNAFVLDPIPPGLTVVDTHGGIYQPGPPPSVIWIIGDLAGLATGSVTLDVQVDAGVPYGSVIDNECWVDCDEADHGGDRLSTSVCEYTYVPLRLDKTDNITDPVSPGDIIKYEIRCYNDNDLPVNNLTIMDALPADVSLAWATSPYTYDAGDREIMWSLGTLGAHSSLLVHLWLSVDQGAVSGDIVNTARVTSDETPTEVRASHTTTIEGGEIMVHFDIKPEECPNGLNPKAKGVLPAAVLGTARFNVRDIDPASLRVTREGVTGGVAPLRWSYGDMSTPATGRPCDCNTQGPDGYRDLGLKFSLVDLVNTLNLGGAAGRTVELMLTGRLNDGTSIRGMDCVRILGRMEDGDGGASLMQPSALSFEVGDQVGVPDGAQVDLSFYSAASGHVTMNIYDVHGRLVANLLDSETGAGSHPMTWNMMSTSGQKVPAGIYFVRLSTSIESVTKKLVIVE